MTEQVTLRYSFKPDKREYPSVMMLRAIRELKALGFPIIGVFAVGGVTHGQLTWWLDEDDQEYHFKWTGVPDQPKQESEDLI